MSPSLGYQQAGGDGEPWNRYLYLLGDIKVSQTTFTCPCVDQSILHGQMQGVLSCALSQLLQKILNSV